MPREIIRSINKLKHFAMIKESLSLEGKQKLLRALKLMKEGLHLKNGRIVGDDEVSSHYYVDSGGRPQSVNASNYHNVPAHYKPKVKSFSKPSDKQKKLKKEEIIDQAERPVVAKEFETNADFNSYVKQRRGIQITPKEQQAIINQEQQPNTRSKYSVTFDDTDDFGGNTTKIVKKLMDSNGKLCWTAFIKSDNASQTVQEAIPPTKPTAPTPAGQKMPQQPAAAKPTAQPTAQPTPAQPAQDTIRVIKSISFDNDTEGADILADFLTDPRLS